MVARCNNAVMSEQLSGVTSRRRFLGVCSAVGLGQTLMPGVLFGMAAQAQTAGAGIDAHAMPKITPEMIDAAAAIAGVTLTADQKSMMLEALSGELKFCGNRIPKNRANPSAMSV